MSENYFLRNPPMMVAAHSQSSKEDVKEAPPQSIPPSENKPKIIPLSTPDLDLVPMLVSKHDFKRITGLVDSYNKQRVKIAAKSPSTKSTKPPIVIHECRYLGLIPNTDGTYYGARAPYELSERLKSTPVYY